MSALSGSPVGSPYSVPVYSAPGDVGYGLYNSSYSYPPAGYGWGFSPYAVPAGYNRGYYVPGEELRVPDDQARIRLRVPADAEVWFDGHKTSQTGTIREYHSPALIPGKGYTYHVRVRWMDHGKPVEKERDVHVRANSRQEEDFNKVRSRND